MFYFSHPLKLTVHSSCDGEGLGVCRKKSSICEGTNNVLLKSPEQEISSDCSRIVVGFWRWEKVVENYTQA